MRPLWYVPLALLPSVVFAAGPAASAGDPTAGKSVYAANCTACHGGAGNGRGPAAIALTPPPTDFTSATWAAGRSDTDLVLAIKSGRPGTSMTAFTTLSDADLANVVAYLRTLSPP